MTNIEIKFKTYSEMKDVEQLLLSCNYKSTLINDAVYYKTYSESAVMNYKYDNPYIMFYVNMKLKLYKLQCHPSSNTYTYVYPNDKVSIRNKFMIPTYGGRKIKKS